MAMGMRNLTPRPRSTHAQGRQEVLLPLLAVVGLRRRPHSRHCPRRHRHPPRRRVPATVPRLPQRLLDRLPAVVSRQLLRRELLAVLQPMPALQQSPLFSPVSSSA